jgi:hypothetical protein
MIYTYYSKKMCLCFPKPCLFLQTHRDIGDIGAFIRNVSFLMNAPMSPMSLCVCNSEFFVKIKIYICFLLIFKK